MHVLSASFVDVQVADNKPKVPPTAPHPAPNPGIRSAPGTAPGEDCGHTAQGSQKVHAQPGSRERRLGNEMYLDKHALLIAQSVYTFWGHPIYNHVLTQAEALSLQENSAGENPLSPVGGAGTKLSEPWLLAGGGSWDRWLPGGGQESGGGRPCNGGSVG